MPRYKSVHTGPQIDSGVARALSGGAIDQSMSSKLDWEGLINPEFTIAQAGIGGNHGSVAYAADCWKLVSGTVSAAPGGGLVLNGTIRQTRETAVGFDAVASVNVTSGTATATYDDAAKQFEITSSGGTIKRAHLGLIAITDWSKMPPTNYLDTLQLCQGRFIRFPLLSGVGYNIIKTDGFDFIVDLPTTMRAIPSATANLSVARCPVGDITAISVDNISINNRIFLIANTSTSIANYSTTSFWNIINFDLIADL